MDTPEREEPEAGQPPQEARTEMQAETDRARSRIWSARWRVPPEQLPGYWSSEHLGNRRF